VTARSLAAVALALLAGCGEREPAAPAPERRPNVVLVSIDSLRPDRLGCYGHRKPTSPAIDALAERGVRFGTAVSTTSWTLPAHAALFTGLYDATHGATDVDLALSRDHATLAEALRAAGWRTVGFFGGPFLDPAFGLDQGFERWVDCTTPLPPEDARKPLREKLAASHEASHKDVTGPRTLEAVERWLGEEREPGPVFVFLHLWDVHYDYVPPREYVELFDPGYEGTLDATDLEDNQAIHAGMPARDLEHLLALYDGEIRFTDDVLAKILAALERERLLEGAIVVVTADHGEEFFEHLGKGHQSTLYDEVVRVPLIICWPGELPAGRVVADQVRLVDLAPTLLALAGVAPLPAAQGRDLGPLLRGGELARAPALLDLTCADFDVVALRTEAHKVLSARAGKLVAGFDLAADPRERTPKGVEHDWVRAGRDELAERLGEARAARARIGAEAGAPSVDAELEERLRRLGYTGDARGGDAKR
jgi:arylsulfatase A-like enzyme